MMGTADYVAPEQILDSHTADIRADLYSLGCTLFHLLTGHPPFDRTTHSSLARKREGHLKETPPDVRSLRPDVPAELAAIVARLLAKRPEDRYATPAEVAAALAAFTRGAQLERLLEGKVEAPPTIGKKRRRGLLLALAVAALVAVGVGIGWFASKPSSMAKKNYAPVNPRQPVPLTVRSFRVFRSSPENEDRGELGAKTFVTYADDRVEFELELSEPAYAYLLAFAPTDKKADQIQLHWPPGDSQPETAQQRLSDKEYGKRFRLNDGIGLQAFALLASRQPLPSFAQWRRTIPEIVWRKIRGSPGLVWRGDGKQLKCYRTSGEVRGQEDWKEPAVLKKLMSQLRAAPQIEALALIAFEVDD
jgi:serine/threonine protein kinase